MKLSIVFLATLRPGAREAIADKVEAALDPTDKGLVRVVFRLERTKPRSTVLTASLRCTRSLLAHRDSLRSAATCPELGEQRKWLDRIKGRDDVWANAETNARPASRDRRPVSKFPVVAKHGRARVQRRCASVIFFAHQNPRMQPTKYVAYALSAGHHLSDDGATLSRDLDNRAAPVARQTSGIRVAENQVGCRYPSLRSALEVHSAA